MEEFKPTLCTICLTVTSDECYRIIEETTKDVLDVLLFKQSIEVNTSVICDTCYTKVLEAFRFKTICIDTENSISPYVVLRNGALVDLKEIHLKKKGEGQLSSVSKDEIICRLCMEIATSRFSSVHDLEADLICQYIPEVNFNLTKDPVICLICVKSLKKHGGFLRNCFGVKKFENVSEDDEMRSQFHVKMEEVEIKSEGNIDDRCLSLEQLLSSLEEDSEDDINNLYEITIALMPPSGELTDEDSEDENDTTIDNLPASQLLSQAELMFDRMKKAPDTGDNSCHYSDDSDVIMQNNDKLHYMQTETKTYLWQRRDIEPKKITWPAMTTVRNFEMPTDLFYKFFDDDVFNTFVTRTNEYALRRNRPPNVTPDEMRAFFGVLLLSGYVTLPRRRMYWETRKDAHNELVANAISRDRFEFIMQNLHFANYCVSDRSDKFAKVRPLFEKLNNKFQSFLPHSENHSLGEKMIPCFGRHASKQFLKGKPIKYGYRIWMGTTSLGYCVWVEPYKGKSTPVDPKYRYLGVGPSVVLQYADVLLNTGKFPFHIFFNDFFTTVPLLDELRKRNIRGTGIVREDRLSKCPLLPKEEMKKKCRGDFDYRSTENEIIVVKWHDNSLVNIASNFYSLSPLHRVTRYSRIQKSNIQVDQPDLIHKYNSFVGGVDRVDQNISSYRVGIRGKKWYFPIIAYCLDLAVQNAWQLHRYQGGKLDQLVFRRQVVETLLESHSNVSRKRGRHSAMEHAESRFDTKGHYLIMQDKQTRCRICHKKVKRKCGKCDVALHMECFVTYHQCSK